MQNRLSFLYRFIVMHLNCLSAAEVKAPLPKTDSLFCTVRLKRESFFNFSFVFFDSNASTFSIQAFVCCWVDGIYAENLLIMLHCAIQKAFIFFLFLPFTFFCVAVVISLTTMLQQFLNKLFRLDVTDTKDFPVQWNAQIRLLSNRGGGQEGEGSESKRRWRHHRS